MTKLLNRRIFLRGLGGACVAAPFLGSVAERAAKAQGTTAGPPQRLIAMFTHYGCLTTKLFPARSHGPLTAADLEVAQEIPMVLNDAGTIGLSLNGKSFPATEPYVATEGDWLVYHYYNEGLQIHPMHQHGVPQLVVAKDGFPLPQPYFADTVNVAPGERYSVLVRPTEAHAPPVDSESPAYWAFHCHILTHAERHDGMFGMVTIFAVTR